MIKALFFDLGNVLVHFDWTRAIDKLTPVSPLEPPAIREIVTSSPLAMQFEKGEIAPDPFFERLRATLQCSLSISELREIWSDIFTPMEDNIAPVRSLKGRFFLGLISNTNPAHVEWIRHRFDFFDCFDRLTFSYDARALKPETAIFDLARGGFDPSEVWFVDDTISHVEGARKLGWHATVLTPDMTLREIIPVNVL